MSIINTALSEYGVKEIIGSKDNLRILKYFNEIGFNGSKLHDETAWCSAFANWVAKTAGYEHSKKLTARSWLTVGESTNTPKIGDIVVFWRESPKSWKGHVGFFIKQTKNYVYVLGGNQRNMVCIKAYAKSRVLDYKKLKKITD
ncbi:TIGR02594 family protein [Pontimicrobium sp. MEBiC06410]|jgi:uncharacterized protein (TIGR02594 family)